MYSGGRKIHRVESVNQQAIFRMKKRIAPFEKLENRQLLAAWQNPGLPCDIDRSGLVTPFDAEILIEEFNQTGPRFLEGQPTENDHRVDVRSIKPAHQATVRQLYRSR